MVEQTSPVVDPAIRAYYDRAPEESRLDLGASQLEQLRSRELTLRHAPTGTIRTPQIGSTTSPPRTFIDQKSCERKSRTPASTRRASTGSKDQVGFSLISSIAGLIPRDAKFLSRWHARSRRNRQCLAVVRTSSWLDANQARIARRRPNGR